MSSPGGAIDVLGGEATTLLNRISESVPVKWDRLIEDGPRLSVYGWIYQTCTACDGEAKRDPLNIACLDCEGSGVDRTLRADFVLVRVEPHLGSAGAGLMVTFFTSSAAYSKPIGVAIWGELASDLHVDCKRVEDELDGVKEAIEL